ncbi:MAG TPA: hypothetical protein PKZ22_05590 [Accumulibacter sp.]|jgi:hypothetical protein|nr:hypothetical protein [Accumulibacter sp.]
MSVALQGSLWRPGLPPGVYEEIPAVVGRPRVRLDVAALIGLAERGPVNTPVVIDDPRQFEDAFGRALPGLNLPLAVRLFFANGGRRCVVLRCLDHRNVRTARLHLPGLTAVRGASRRQARLAARNPGAWGNGLGLRCRAIQRPLPLELELDEHGKPRVRLPRELVVGTTLRLLGRPATAGAAPRSRLFHVVAAAGDDRRRELSPKPTQPFLHQELLRNAVAVTLTLEIHLDGHQVEVWEDAAPHVDHPRYLPRLLGRRAAAEALRPPARGSAGGVTADEADRLWGDLDEPWGSAFIRPSALLADASLMPGKALLASPNGLYLSMAEMPPSRRGRDAGATTERRHFFAPTEMDAADRAEDADHRFVAFKDCPGALDALREWDNAFPFEPAALLAVPDLLHPSPPPARIDPPLVDDGAPCFAADGTRAAAERTRPAFDYPLLGFDAASLREAQRQLVDHCEAQGGRIAMLDLPPRLRAGEVVDWRRALASDRAALYAPWLRVDADGTARTVPPAAAACGIVAQVENQVGVWGAPANRPLAGVFARDDDAGLPDPGFLFGERIDEVRATERGLLLLGARTTANDPEWTHLSVRRLIDWLKAQIAADLAWAPFEPNNAALWSAMAATARRRLRAVFDAGALAGRTDADSFFVRCDAGTHTTADLDAGRAILLVGVAPAVPAEFIVFRLLRHGADDPRLEVA